MLVTLITPTGGRPEAFALCQNWMKNQTYKGDIQWILLDDCREEQALFFTGNQQWIPAPVKWSPEFNTQRMNMEALLAYSEGDIILFIEDDDYYSTEYVETMVSLLKNASIAGLSYSKYYHVGVPGYLTMTNYKHASLAQTGIRKSLLKRTLKAVNSGHFYFDIELWKSCMQDGIPNILLANTDIGIGIKGMPGKKGLSNGHNEDNYTPDVDLNVLKGWLGKDAEHYKGFIK